MKQIRVSNIPHLACAPFKILKDLSWISYEEHNPLENLALLRQGKLDCALIPAVDFVRDCSFQSLDFCMGARQQTGSMILYTNAPISRLERIFVYSCSSSSTALLKLILLEKYNLTPTFVKLSTDELDIPLQETDGMLSLHDLPGKIRNDFLGAHDLGSLWYRHTGLPFVFLIWAIRPKALRNKEVRALSKIMYLASSAKHEFATEFASTYGVTQDDASEFVSDNRRFYLDSFLKAGLSEFLLRSHTYGLLPKTNLRTAQIPIISNL